MYVLNTHFKQNCFLSCKQILKIYSVCRHLSESHIYQNIPHLLPKNMWKNFKITRQKLLITLMKG